MKTHLTSLLDEIGAAGHLLERHAAGLKCQVLWSGCRAKRQQVLWSGSFLVRLVRTPQSSSPPRCMPKKDVVCVNKPTSRTCTHPATSVSPTTCLLCFCSHASISTTCKEETLAMNLARRCLLTAGLCGKWTKSNLCVAMLVTHTVFAESQAQHASGSFQESQS